MWGQFLAQLGGIVALGVFAYMLHASEPRGRHNCKRHRRG